MLLYIPNIEKMANININITKDIMIRFSQKLDNLILWLLDKFKMLANNDNKSVPPTLFKLYFIKLYT